MWCCWINLAYDIDQWRALVSMEMNFRFYKRRGIFYVAVIFETRTYSMHSSNHFRPEIHLNIVALSQKTLRLHYKDKRLILFAVILPLSLSLSLSILRAIWNTCVCFVGRDQIYFISRVSSYIPGFKALIYICTASHYLCTVRTPKSFQRREGVESR
jgi:hypothetical protein